MSTKTLLISAVLSGLLLFTAPNPCLADASTETVRAIAPNPSGLIAHYEFEGDAVDTSGFQPLANGTLFGNPTFVAGVFGQGIDLDGYGDYVDCGNASYFDITEQITVTAWIKVVEFDKKYQTIISKGDDSWRLARAGKSNRIEFACNGTSANKWNGIGEVPWAISSTTDVNDGKWHHIVGVFDGTFLYLYIDGALEAAKGAAKSIYISSYNVCIGANAQVPGCDWNGLIEDMRIYNYALSQAEIVSIMGKNEIHLPEPTSATLYNIAKTYEKLSKHGQAKSIYQLILQRYPDSEYTIEAQFYIARRNIFSLTNSGNYTDAQAAIDKFTADFAKHPALPGTLYWFAKEFEARERYERAKGIYQQVVQQHPDSSHAFKALLGVSKMDVLSSIESGNDTAAQAALATLIADFNDHPDLPDSTFEVGHKYYTKARLKVRDGLEEQATEYYQKAITHWERIIHVWPRCSYAPRAYYCSAVVYSQELGEHLKGIDYYQQIVDNWPDYQYASHAQFLVGKNYEILRDSNSVTESEANPKIEQAYKGVVEKYPDSKSAPSAALKLARMNLLRGQRVEAAMYYELFLAIADPSDTRIKNVKARLEQMKGENQ
ncbi:MAG: LamG-like jellyroll fold domain-containing protein [Planctomycetota bacterium]|jgi:TolA-binding protein